MENSIFSKTCPGKRGWYSEDISQNKWLKRTCMESQPRERISQDGYRTGPHHQNLSRTGKKKNSREVVAADDLNFTISNGKLCGLLGPSGCGKSTALNMISGLLKPTSGEIFRRSERHGT
ncbi:ATP-binding cassette domain-containing protein [Allobaculum sp. Allo2]|uniref:ATP-binding cassette domain-containing protein n=1 Tax=Allobaculum sp. Allo2 TaxID=2853432 RepID=UPI0021124E8F|nr:ATP-binding cassette domain-containing protein [Allobaculum sp. Allo2]UNT93661.1 ATP-binding cassette domain-containing protein [Allobaculum sp. Allo2]